MFKRRIEAKIVNPLLGSKEVPTPVYATNGSAAMDLRACIAESVTIPPKGRKLIGTGLAVNMNDPTIAAYVSSRSGLSLKNGVRVHQGFGLIDSDYHGEIGVILANDTDEPFVVQKGDRIAQLMFVPVIQVELDFIEEFSSVTERGEGGFGSTGVSN